MVHPKAKVNCISQTHSHDFLWERLRKTLTWASIRPILACILPSRCMDWFKRLLPKCLELHRMEWLTHYWCPKSNHLKAIHFPAFHSNCTKHSTRSRQPSTLAPLASQAQLKTVTSGQFLIMVGCKDLSTLLQKIQITTAISTVC